MNGKGDKQRPQSVDDSTMQANWDTIFGKKKKESVVDQWMKYATEGTIEERNAWMATLSEKQLAELQAWAYSKVQG